jgi:putative component of toxin-antitoxin plasmid stabilization module
MHQIEHYLSRDERDLFADWLASLADRRARAFTLARVGRMEAGAFGGDKRKQKADIENAVSYWNDWQERNRK